ncbi:hypothetical protein [Ilumatobacter sp.]|uniref:hypothetical protein n=1 Tax=Ilumatobacter sp. TaxID=1967498 RepID=UPI003B5298AB
MGRVLTPRPAGGSGLDLFRSALTPPFAAGMSLDPVPLVDGSFDVHAGREVVVLVRLRRPLADEALVVRGSVDGSTQPDVVFSPFTQEGTMLPVFRPEHAAGSDGSGPFVVDAVVHRLTDRRRHHAHPSPGPAMARADAAELVDAVVLQGRFARMLLLATLEKQRCLRTIRETAAARHLELASSGALDERGRSLLVPRRLDPREPDDAYRARLGIYSSWILPTPGGFERALNGSGDAADANSGLPGRAGIDHRFRVVEETNELSIAMKIVGVGPDAAADFDSFQTVLETIHLVDLDRPTPTRMPAEGRARREAIRATIAAEVTRVGDPLLTRRFTPLVASSFDRAVRLMRALGHTAQIRLLRGHERDGGSRYELGLGIDIAPPTAAQLTSMAAGVGAVAGRGDDIAALASGLEPRSPAEDPSGSWIFEPCGFRTVHPVGPGVLHLSPLPTFGMWVDGPDQLSLGETATFEARAHPPGEAVGVHRLVAESLANVDDTMSAAGLPPLPSPIPPNDVIDRIGDMTSSNGTPPSNLDAAFAAGVVISSSTGFAENLLRVFNFDQLAAFSIPSSAVAAFGSPEDVRDGFIAWSDALITAGFHSVRPVWDDAFGEVVIVASISQLPASTAIGVGPPGASFYWYETRLPKAQPGSDDPLKILQARGGKAVVTTGRTGLALLVAISYSRRGLADPFEVRIELDDPTAVLERDEYGFMMNLLDHLHPIGIEVNTFDMRRHHVDADGDGTAEFLSSSASRTYHQDRRRRDVGRLDNRNTRRVF